MVVKFITDDDHLALHGETILRWQAYFSVMNPTISSTQETSAMPTQEFTTTIKAETTETVTTTAIPVTVTSETPLTTMKPSTTLSEGT